MPALVYPPFVAQDDRFKALADVGRRIPALPKAQIMAGFADAVPAEFLFLLAEKWSVTGYDGWLMADSETAKRRLIRRAAEIHRHKGTPWAVRELFRVLGLGEVEIWEAGDYRSWDGSLTFDGAAKYDQEDRHWAEYDVVLARAVTADEAEIIRKMLRYITPARCHLRSLRYEQVAYRWDGVIDFSGDYAFGAG